MDLDINITSDGLVKDRSPFGNTMSAQNTPTEADSLCHQTAPVQAISAYRDVDDPRKMLVIAGGQVYDVSI
jgi:hypothetical protein